MRPFMKSTGRGAATSIHVASDPDLDLVTGGYFANSKPKRSSERSQGQTDGARLWAMSTQLVGLSDPR
jgi:retinol dehydrogenase 14